VRVAVRLPFYSRISSVLRKRILSGEIAPGAKLPSESELCEMFHASRITVRQALHVLHEENLLQSQQGRGSFVSPCPSRRIPLANTDFCGSAIAHAPEMEIRLEEWGRIAPPLEIAERLCLAGGEPVVFARRTAILGQEGISYDELYLVESHASLLSEDDFAATLFVERWREVGSVSITYAEQVIEAIAAERPVTDVLPVQAGSPILKATEVFFLGDGRPGGAMVMYLRPDIFRLNCVVQLGEAVGARGAETSLPRRVLRQQPKTREGRQQDTLRRR
jgi:GntR family transcriptional regulator